MPGADFLPWSAAVREELRVIAIREQPQAPASAGGSDLPLVAILALGESRAGQLGGVGGRGADGGNTFFFKRLILSG
jgi:hypothetical protein